MNRKMGRAPCCEKLGLKRGRWTAEEDLKLRKYIEANGEGSWRSLPKNAGLLRCGKSCRLRWINYLRSDLKRGNISAEEEKIIINLHASLGNRWSLIAGHMPGRTDNEIKNYWNSHLSRKIHSFRQPNPHFIPPVVAAVSAAKSNRQTGSRTGRSAMKKNKNSDHKSNIPKPSQQTQDTNGVANAAVPMPTTPTPEKEALSSTTQWQENNGGNVNEGMGIENRTLCLYDIMEDFNGIWSLDEERENEVIVNRGEERELENVNMGSGGEKWGAGNGNCNTRISSENGEWNLMSSPGNSWDWDWDWEGATAANDAWGQEENTFSWLWARDNEKTDSTDVSFEMDKENRNATLS